jgi:uncharacterized protein (TIGR02118 family)
MADLRIGVRCTLDFFAGALEQRLAHSPQNPLARRIGVAARGAAKARAAPHPAQNFQPSDSRYRKMFIVVCYRRRDCIREQFRRYFLDTHGPLATAIPGVRRYVQSFVEPDERGDPPWDAVLSSGSTIATATTARASADGLR